MIFIPFGVNQNDQNRYELTQYINDVTTQNTQVLMEYSNESGITAYTYGNERLSYETNGVNYKYNYDGRGSVTNLLDNNNTSVVEYNYQPFGETEILGTKAQELENTYQFNAESTDALTGLQYLRARYYDSKTGRFTSADTYLGEITDPLSRNLYLYTKNDPVNYVDPSEYSLISIISNAIQNVVNVVQNVAKTVVSATKKVVNVVKNIVSNENVKKVIDKATYEQNEIKRILSTKNVGVYGPVINQNTAKTNPKAAQSQLLEYQIKELRKLNTKNSNEIADKLQEEMKKFCESDLPKISLYDPYKNLNENEREIAKVLEAWDRNRKQTMEQIGSAVTGFASTVALDTVEFFGGSATGIGYLFSGKNPLQGYTDFNDRIVEPVREYIEEKEPDKQAYNVGEIAGNVFEIVSLINGISKLITKGIPKISRLFTKYSAGGTGGGGGVAAVLSESLVAIGAVAETVATVGVLANGMALGANYAIKFAENVQEFSENGNGGNETGKTTGGSKKNNINSEEWERNLENTTELNKNNFKNLENSGKIVKVNRSGGDRPVVVQQMESMSLFTMIKEN